MPGDIDATLQTDLTPLGFQARGKSFTRTSSDRQLAIVALAGRFTRSNAKCLVVCFRHTFLRDVHGRLPDPFPLEPSSFPVKLSPTDLSGLSLETWQYRSDLLRFPCGYLETVDETVEFCNNVSERLLRWADALTPALLHEQIRGKGQDGHAERIWIEDYHHHEQK